MIKNTFANKSENPESLKASKEKKKKKEKNYCSWKALQLIRAQ